MNEINFNKQLKLKKQITALCDDNRDGEICGLVVSENNRLNALKCKNMSFNTDNSFVIDALDYLNCSEKGEIKAVFHSHRKKPEFSELDRQNSNNHKIPFILYCQENKKFNFYYPNENYDNIFINRDFDIKRNNCYTLVKDYYKHKYNIDFPDYSIDEDWFESNPNLILEEYEKSGFKKTDVLEAGDIILMSYNFKSPDSPTHIAVYMGDNVILHHPRNKKSTYCLYSEEQRRRTIFILKHDRN